MTRDKPRNEKARQNIRFDRLTIFHHRGVRWRWAVLFAGASFLAIFFASVTFIPRAGGSLSSSLEELTAKPEWSFAGRDLLGWWIHENLGNPEILGAPFGEASINLKTPLDIPLGDYLGLEEVTGVTLWKVDIDPVVLNRFRVTKIISLVECLEGGQEGICPIAVFTSYGIQELEPPSTLFPVQFADSSVGLVDSRLLHFDTLVQERSNG